MKISRIVNEHLKAYQINQQTLEKQKEQQFQHAVEKKRLDRIEETRVERAKRLGLDKGTNVDLDC
jgi:hypothetical protein